MNETTLLVSQLVGPILVVMGLGFLFNLKFFLGVYKDFGKSSMMTLVLGMMTMLVGLLIVMRHNLWSTPAEIIVSIFGWGALVKGVAFLVAPKLIAKLTNAIANKSLMVVAIVVVLAVGGYLSWVVYF